MNSNSIILQKRFILFLLLFFAVSIYLMNFYVPFFSDDLQCTYFDNHEVNSISDIIKVLRFDHEEINGRIIPNFFALITVRAGERVFNIVNTILTVFALILLWLAVGCRNKEKSFLEFLVLTIGFLLLSTGVDSLYYWAASATNYVWTLVPVLFFIYLMEKKELKVNPIFLFILAIILGIQHEIYVCPIAGAYWIVSVFGIKRMTKEKWTLLIGFTIGMLIVALAPGNFNRGVVGGLGIISRIVKIFYFLRIFYVLLFLLVVLFLQDRRRTVRFLKDNIVFALIIVLGGVIPFLSAGNSRSVYGIEIFSLILLVKAVDQMIIFRRHLNMAVSIVLTLFLLWFQCSVVYASSIKWGIYKKAVWQYEHQKSNMVIMNDYQCSNSFIEKYTMNMNNILTPCDKAHQLAFRKCIIQKKNIPLDKVPEDMYIKIVPANIDTVTSVGKISFVGFVNHPEMQYYIMPYKPGVVDRINKGYFYVMYRLPIIGKKLKINYLEGDVDFERAAYDIVYNGRRYILLNKKYKHYPLIKLMWMGFNDEKPEKKIELE